MKNTSLLMPLFRAIDKVIFGIDDYYEVEKEPESIEQSSNEDIEIEGELQIVVDCH